MFGVTCAPSLALTVAPMTMKSQLLFEELNCRNHDPGFLESIGKSCVAAAYLSGTRSLRRLTASPAHSFAL
jgi:hypothetical protein